MGLTSLEIARPGHESAAPVYIIPIVVSSMAHNF